MCAFCKTLKPGLRDLRPSQIFLNTKNDQFSLDGSALPDSNTLRGDNETAAFLSVRAANGEECTEGDTVWQVGCVLLALVCGKSPFLRNRMARTLLAIEECDAELSGAGNLKEACEEILEAMKNARDLNDFEKRLEKLGDGNSRNDKSGPVAETSPKQVENTSSAVEH